MQSKYLMPSQDTTRILAVGGGDEQEKRKVVGLAAVLYREKKSKERDADAL